MMGAGNKKRCKPASQQIWKPFMYDACLAALSGVLPAVQVTVPLATMNSPYKHICEAR
jgi:hypothetical protein